MLSVAESVFVYRWIDPVNSDVHYSEVAPNNVRYEMISIAIKSPSVDPEAQRRSAEMERYTDQRIETRTRRREAEKLAVAAASARKVDCTHALDWKARLKSRPGPKMLVIDAEGNARRMTEAERQKRLAAVRQQVSLLCTAEN